ncbi:MAG: outer membrane protein transport protein [Ignavibacteriales bacterium]|nr:MAG: outer membrane protein transport protein [Ignavibacteriales bacterium]
MKHKITLFIFSALFLFNTSLLANGLSLNSVGPRAFGMGGAFVGLANDYSAIYWNPAGLSLLNGNYISIFGTDIIPTSTYKYAPAGVDAESKVNHYLSPNLMGYLSFKPSIDLTIGLGVYVPAGIGSEWEGADLKNLAGGNTVEWMSKIGVINISPVVAYKINENFQVGAAFNIYYAMFDLKRHGGGPAQYSEESTGLGFGVTIGALVKVNDMISVGASFRTKSNVTMNGTATNPAMLAIPGNTAAESDFDRDVAWPMWIAGGISVRPIDKLTLALDAQYSQWSKSENELVTEFKNQYWSGYLTPSGANKFILQWKDATQIRFGAEYEATECLKLRTGYYYDPAPAPDNTYNVLFPSMTYNGFTLGASYKISDFTIEGGAEYLIGGEREIPAPTSATDTPRFPGTHQTNITAFTIGVGYEF